MALDNIDKALERYFEGISTIAEEELLKQYFQNGHVAPHLEKYAPMFRYLSLAKEEKSTRELPALAFNVGKKYEWYKMAGIAAVLAFGIYFGNSYRQNQLKERQEALIAYQETKKALELLAENFNKGREKIAYLNEFEVTKQKIYNND